MFELFDVKHVCLMHIKQNQMSWPIALSRMFPDLLIDVTRPSTTFLENESVGQPSISIALLGAYSHTIISLLQAAAYIAI